MKFYFSLKVIKENKQKVNLKKKQHISHQQTKEIKQLQQIATLKYNYSSSHNGGTPSIAPGFQRSLNFSAVATVSFTRPSRK